MAKKDIKDVANANADTTNNITTDVQTPVQNVPQLNADGTPFEGEVEVMSDNIWENPEIALDKTEDFVQKNSKVIITVLVVSLVAAAAFFGYRYVAQNQQEEALKQLFPAEFNFEKDSLKTVLKGNGNNLGVVKIAEDYSMAKASNVAELVAATVYMRDGKFQDAVNQLDKFSSDDMIVQARAYCLRADAAMELTKYEDAINFYKKAADHYPNKYFTPIYLMKLALAYESNKNKEKAIEIYNEVVNKYQDSQDATTAKKYKAMLEK